MSDDSGDSSGWIDSGGSDGDSVEEITSRSWLGRLGGSLMAAVIGLVLFVASFPLLWRNEGRAVAAIDSLNAGARSVVSVPADKVDPANEGKLVHVTGTATADGTLTDPVFRTGPRGALRLRRHVEMYQWKEHEESKTEKRVGGGETTHTTYTYRREWSETPIDSSRFKQPNGHANPTMAVRSRVFDAEPVQLAGFRIDAALVQKLADFKAWVPPASVTGAEANPPFKRDGERFYRGANPQAPAVGDLQVRFEVIESQPVSLVGAQLGRTIAPYQGRDGRTIALVDPGTRTAAQMFQEARDEEATLTWILRAVGFAVMVIGLTMASAPVAWLASLLPILEDLVGIVGFFAALCLAVPLTLTTIAVAWLAHRPLLGAGLILGGLALAYGIRKIAPARARPRAAAMKAAA